MEERQIVLLITGTMGEGPQARTWNSQGNGCSSAASKSGTARPAPAFYPFETHRASILQSSLMTNVWYLSNKFIGNSTEAIGN